MCIRDSFKIEDVARRAVLHHSRRDPPGGHSRLCNGKLGLGNAGTAGRAAYIELVSLLVCDHRIVSVDVDDRSLHLKALGPDGLSRSVNIRSSVLGIADHILAKIRIFHKSAFADALTGCDLGRLAIILPSPFRGDVYKRQDMGSYVFHQGLYAL